ncbi:Fc.00g043950.m01.CDS01 [Cosmosporella sp. VM-42]
MDDSQKRTSGIPRFSKLPMPRPTSGIPKPTSTIPRPSSVIRPAPSKENLRGGNTAAAPAGESRSTRLRSSASRDQLRSSIGAGGELRNPRLRPSASREQLHSSAARPSVARPKALPPSARSNTSRVPSTPLRPTETIAEQSTTPPYDPPAELEAAAESDEYLFKRRLTLTRRPSEVFLTSPLHDHVSNFDNVEEQRPTTASTEDGSGFDTIKARSRKPRPSLSERTMETLAQIPSSPALSKKSSTFFDQGRPRSRADSGASRPGSSYTSDGSGRPRSRPPSRPSSSSGQADPSFVNFRASTNTYKPPLTTISGTPSGTPNRRTSGVQVARTPKPRMTPGRVGLTSTTKRPPTTPSLAGVRSPSPEKTYSMLPPKSGSKTLAARPTKARAPAKGLFKKPSLPALDRSALDSGSSRNTSVNSSWDGTIPSSASTTGSMNTADSPDQPTTPSSSRKSSSALREQIAKAKAAKRAQMRQSSGAQPSSDLRSPIIPSDDGFDFGVNHEDPFNLGHGKNPGKKVLQQRVNTARTSGKLNIAALNLKEIPVEVMKMYDLESIGTFDGSWAESVDLTRLIAADNEFETLDDFIFPDSTAQAFEEAQAGQGSIFAGLETLDMHGNLLVGVPLGFRRLTCLTSLNLSSNRLTNNSLDTIAQISGLRDLKLANNLFFGPLNPNLSNLNELEILDVHGNNISALPKKIENMSRLRILNLSENSFESLPFDGLASLPLTELNVKKNKLSGTLIEEEIDSLPQLQSLDASINQLTRLVPLGRAISFPVAHSVSLSTNRLQGLPDMTSWTSLLTLTVNENNISGIPNSFTSLEKLRHADFSSNDIRVVPPEISRMENLSMLRLSGNPLRDKKFLSITTEDLKEILTGRLEPPPPYQAPEPAAGILDILGDKKVAEGNPDSGNLRLGDDENGSDDDFTTPPQSPSRSRSHTVSSRRSRSHTVSNQTWAVKPGGILDRSRTESSSLHPVVCSKVAAEHQIRQVFLGYNLFTGLPNSLSFFAATLSTLSLAHNQLVGETYLTEELELPALKELNLSSNHISGLEPLIKFLHAPKLEKIDVCLNRINAIPLGLKEALPSLNVLLAANNHIAELDPDSIKGLRIVDAGNNDITFLNPRLGLLGGSGGLERLEVMGNRFRVPRWNVLERGTDATLRWLRGRVPVAEMATWKGEDEELQVD